MNTEETQQKPRAVGTEKKCEHCAEPFGRPELWEYIINASSLGVFCFVCQNRSPLYKPANPLMFLVSEWGGVLTGLLVFVGVASVLYQDGGWGVFFAGPVSVGILFGLITASGSIGYLTRAILRWVLGSTRAGSIVGR